MVEYYYDVESEVFKRADNRGNYLAINVAEAQRIISLLDLGYSVIGIKNKVQISNPRCKSSTVDSFIKNYNQGNINMPEDAPAPALVFESFEDENRLDALEKRVSELESELDELKNNGLTSKVKSWIRG